MRRISLVVTTALMSGCYTYGDWHSVKYSPEYEETREVQTRWEPRVSLSVGATAFDVEGRLHPLCSSARFGRMRRVEAREASISGTAKAGWGAATLGVAAGGAALGSSWASDASHPTDGRLVGAGILLAAAAVGFATWPGTATEPSRVEGREKYEGPASEWVTENEAACTATARKPLARRLLRLVASTPDGQGIRWDAKTDDEGKATFAVASTVRAIAYWCGPTTVTTRLEASDDESATGVEGRGTPASPSHSELGLVSERLTIKSASSTAIADIKSTIAREMAQNCASAAQSSCLSQLKPKLPALTSDCLNDCLQEQAEECAKRRATCLKAADDDRAICDEMAMECVDKLAMRPAVAACQNACVAARKEAACPSPK